MSLKLPVNTFELIKYTSQSNFIYESIKSYNEESDVGCFL